MNHFLVASIGDAIDMLGLLVFVFIVVPGIIIWGIYVYIQDLRRGKESFVRTTWKGFKRILKTLWNAIWNF